MSAILLIALLILLLAGSYAGFRYGGPALGSGVALTVLGTIVLLLTNAWF